MTVRQYSIGILLGILSGTGAGAQSYNISTIAGNNSVGFSGDSGPATQAQLDFPGGIAVASNGDVYISDTANNRVRLVSKGTITTIAGTGTAGYVGDKAAATAAELNSPTGLALDSSGNLYIADSANNVIRQVTPGGTITTWAGNGVQGYTGDGGPANVSNLFDPVAITFDSSGNAYICDAGNNVVREVNTSSVIFTLVGGTNTIDQLSHPNAVGVASGYLYVADTDNRRIMRFKLSNYVLTQYAGTELIGFSGDGGPAVDASFDDPFGLAVDAAGNVYIADTFNSRIRFVSAATGIISTIAGTGSPGYFGDGGPALGADLYFPHTLTVDSKGSVYIVDTFNQVIRLLQAATPKIISNGVVNAASYVAEVSPGALASVFGSSFASAESIASAVPLPTNLADVSVTVNGKSAPILAVTPGQINFQVPWETAIGEAAVVVTVNGKASNTAKVSVVAAGPGIFSAGGGRAVVQNSNGLLNAANNPAKTGTMITAYLTGSGPVTAAVADGAPTPLSPLIYSTSKYSATIGSASAEVQFAGLAPNWIGLVQMNIQVPSGLAGGNYPLTVSIDDQTSNAAIISIAQ